MQRPSIWVILDSTSAASDKAFNAVGLGNGESDHEFLARYKALWTAWLRMNHGTRSSSVSTEHLQLHPAQARTQASQEGR